MGESALSRVCVESVDTSIRDLFAGDSVEDGLECDEIEVLIEARACADESPCVSPARMAVRRLRAFRLGILGMDTAK